MRTTGSGRQWGSVEIGQIVEARVIEVNKGGLAVDVNGIRGFLPISQIDLYRVENVEQFINQRLRCMVAEADQFDREGFGRRFQWNSHGEFDSSKLYLCTRDSSPPSP